MMKITHTLSRRPQQNILRERMSEIIGLGLALAAGSNPALVEANIAKKNAAEFERISDMSVRELLVEKLSKRKDQLNSLIKFGGELKVEGVEITDVDPKDITPRTPSLTIDGVLSMRNDSDDFISDFRDCELAMVLNGKQIDEFQECGNSVKAKNIKSKGGKEKFKFQYRLSGEENIKTFYDLFQSGQMQNIGWKFKPSHRSYIKSSSDEHMVFRDGGNLNEELQKVTADLSVMKK